MYATLSDTIQAQLEVEIEKTYYEFTRYKLPATFALLYFNGELPLKVVQDLIRTTDSVLWLNNNYYFFIFHYTEETDAIKAAENLIYGVDKYLNNTDSYIALDCIDTIESAHSTLQRLYQIVQEAKRHANNRVEDENILNDIY